MLSRKSCIPLLLATLFVVLQCSARPADETGEKQQQEESAVNAKENGAEAKEPSMNMKQRSPPQFVSPIFVKCDG
jgi:hypothetical protein